MLKEYENKSMQGVARMIKIKINHEHGLKGHKKDAIVEIETDHDGVPMDSFWRRRLKDSAIDNCVEIVKEVKSKKGGK